MDWCVVRWLVGFCLITSQVTCGRYGTLQTQSVGRQGTVVLSFQDAAAAAAVVGSKLVDGGRLWAEKAYSARSVSNQYRVARVWWRSDGKCDDEEYEDGEYIDGDYEGDEYGDGDYEGDEYGDGEWGCAHSAPVNE